ncbi:MAG: N-acetylmuramoyl-L-alanine amidase [Chthoniobacterales bacterium]
MPRIVCHLLLCVTAAALTSCSTTEMANRKDSSRTFTTVVVDAGHGGKDSGASRRYGPAEKVAALDLAQRLDRKLRAAQFRTVMTRSSDVFIPLDQRVSIGNRQDNSIFVSLHFNDSGRRGFRGIETYYASPYARSLAMRIQNKLGSLPGTQSRGVKQGNFRVIKNSVYPSVLVECGFLSNRGEARRVGSPAYRELLAGRIAEAILEERHGGGISSSQSRTASTGRAGTSGPGNDGH